MTRSTLKHHRVILVYKFLVNFLQQIIQHKIQHVNSFLARVNYCAIRHDR